MDPVRVAWPGGEHDFALPLGRVRALQTDTNAGPEELFNRLRLGTWRVDDLIAIFRHGLIGGGYVPQQGGEDAGQMVTRLFDLHPHAAFKLPASLILRHILFGPEDDQVGKPGGAESPGNGSSPKSTEPEPS